MPKCACNCGGDVTIYKGRPRRFIHGHNTIGTKIKRASLPPTVRFWRFVTPILDSDACWEWQGYRHYTGYGLIGAGGRNAAQLFAHRVAYEAQNGAIPEGYDVLHRCDNPPCVRGSHLFTGLHIDNMADMARKGRIPHGESHRDAKMTAEKVAEIRQLYAAGGTYKGIARAFGIVPTSVKKIVLRTSWKHILP